MRLPCPSLRFCRPPVSYLLEHSGLDHELVGFEQLGERVLLPERRLQVDVFGPVEARPDGASTVGFFHGETLEEFPPLIQRSALRAEAETSLFFQAPNLQPVPLQDSPRFIFENVGLTAGELDQHPTPCHPNPEERRVKAMQELAVLGYGDDVVGHC